MNGTAKRGMGSAFMAAGLRLALILAPFAPSMPTTAKAATSAWAKSDFVQARLLSAVDGTGDLETIPLGLEVKLDDDWKTYWRSPGDAGLPPALSWTGSSNLQSATLLYPHPQRLTLLGLQTFGYKHDVIFPIDGRLGAKGQPLDLKLKLDLLVCAALCVPRTLDLALRIPNGAAIPGSEAQAIAKARAAVPGGSQGAGLAVQSAAEVSDKGAPALEIKATALDGFDAPDIIAEITPAASLGLPRVNLSPDRRAATFLVPLSEKLPPGAALSGRDAVLTLIDGDRALEQPIRIAKGASADAEAPGPSLIAILTIALLGGLVLNVMPCVLPVLSLKIIALARHGAQSPGHRRAGFFATAAGIVVSFLALAGILIAIKAAGHSIGWGLQFQQPAFIAAMAVVVTMFACNVWGVFEVPVPRFAARLASARTGADDNLAGHFITGVFATILATPCTAPFVGTAVGFALVGEPLRLLSIFLALGLGLALPYLAVATLPGIAMIIPKPGRWMLWVKQAMGIPLIATAIWLLSILETQTGLLLTGMVATCLVIIAALLVFRTRTLQGGEGRFPAFPLDPFVIPTIIVLTLGAIVLPALPGSRSLRTGAFADTIAWRDFDRSEIKSLVSQGKTVFVDVTADWCLTCQANARLVLSQPAIAGRLNTHAIAMRADWTRPDPAISAYLAQYGRYGIPFNIIYGPSAPTGIVLPELLTSSAVTGALDKAVQVERRSSLDAMRVE